MKKHGIGIGIVGMGFMGLTHFTAAQSLRGGQVAAFVTADPRKKRGDFRGIRGNFGEGGRKVDLGDIRVYPTLDGLVKDERVDLVDICLPSYLHASATRRALRAGKHVLVEKPVALTVAQATGMISTAQQSGQMLMVGQVLKYFPEFAWLAQTIRAARWGKLLALHLRRIIAKPDWGDTWFADPAKSGGMVVDLHIHDTDFIVHLFGKPRAVTSQGVTRNRSVDALKTTYHYRKSGPLLTAEAGWINGASLPFEHGFDAFFERASAHFNSSHAPQPVLHQRRKSGPVKLPVGDGFAVQLEEAVRGVRRGDVPAGLSAYSATDALRVCKAEEKSARSGKTVPI